MTVDSPRSSIPAIFWSPVWALAAMQGAITLMWVIYNLYLPQFLGQFGFPVAAVTVLLVVENLLSVGMEPLMGSFSDRTQRWVGTRFPFISAGVILASILFIAIPAVVVLGGTATLLMRSLLILVLIAWALSMTVFRSPALSLLGRYAIASRMPLAASILTLVGAVTGAVAPIANNALLQLGAPIAFTAGTFVLLGAAALLRWVSPPTAVMETAQADAEGGLKWQRLGLIFLAGVGISIGFRLMLTVIPLSLSNFEASPISERSILVIFFITIALTALPMGAVASVLGNQRAMLAGLWVLAIALGVFLVNQDPFLVVILTVVLGAAFCLVSNGTLPFALSLVPPARAGLATGLFFGGGALGVSLFVSLIKDLSFAQSLMGGAIAFLAAAACIALCPQDK